VEEPTDWRIVAVAVAALVLMVLALVAMVWLGAWRLAETWGPGD
jgi:hypothetical protein